LFECRKFSKLNEACFVAPGRHPIGIHSEGTALDCTPHRVVHDDKQDRQIVQGRGMMYRGRVAEHIRAVADDGHDRAVRARKLGAKRCAGAPTKS
jgi:hypothetical protein